MAALAAAPDPLSRRPERPLRAYALISMKDAFSGRPVQGRPFCCVEGVVSLLVLKFGGTSVADIDRIRNVAAHVKREVDAGHAIAVVVSAMAGHTNQLVALVEQAWGYKERLKKTEASQ